jgi:putative ABC transport system substrate-binding protein
MDMPCHTTRRGFLLAAAGTCGAALLLAAPALAASPPPSSVPRVGFLRHGSPPDPFAEGFRQGLRELGYIEGKNIVVEYRWTEGKIERVPELAQDLVRGKVRVIVGSGEPVLYALKKATATIPIVMGTSQDPVGSGFVASLARPGGNITGMTSNAAELAGKRLELLKQAFPNASRIAVLWDQGVGPDQLRSTEKMSGAFGLQFRSLEVRSPGDLERVIATAQKERIGAFVVLGSTTLFAQRSELAALVGRARLPAMYSQGGFVEAGGLMSYGAHLPELFRRAASYVDRILKGATPGDLPVEQASRFELVVNMKAAKALGITIPEKVLVRADRVIE